MLVLAADLTVATGDTAAALAAALAATFVAALAAALAARACLL